MWAGYLHSSLLHCVDGKQAHEFIPLSVAATTWDASSKTSTTTTTSSSGCSMSPPEEFDRLTVHVQSDCGLDHFTTKHCLTSSSASTNRHRCVDSVDPDSVSSAARVQLEMIELDRQLARIKLRCMNLVANTSETSTPTTGTITSTDSVSSSSSSTRAVSSADWDWPRTPPRRAAVPRMGIRRRCTNRPLEDPLGVAQPRDVETATPVTTPQHAPSTTQQFNSSSQPTAAYTGHFCPDNGHGMIRSLVEDIQVTELPGVRDNTTPASDAVIRDGASMASHFSCSSTLVAANRHPCCDNTAPLTASTDNYYYTSASNRPSNVSQNSATSADSRRLENDRLSNKVDNLPNNGSEIGLHQPSSSEKNHVVDATPVSPNNEPTSRHLLKSSSVAAVRSPQYEVGERTYSNFATYGRKSFPSRETVSGSVSRSSQTDLRRRSQLYRRYADVMYTNQDNLQHTMAIQQALFRQQLDGSQTRQTHDGGDATTSRRTDRAMEWVVKRRADGSRYITPVSYTHLTLPTNREV